MPQLVVFDELVLIIEFDSKQLTWLKAIIVFFSENKNGYDFIYKS